MISGEALTDHVKTMVGILDDGKRRDDLERLWQKQREGGANDGNSLIVAAVLMMGKQQPTPVTALSVARSMEATPTWQGLLHLGRAIKLLHSNVDMSPVYKEIVGEAIRAASSCLIEEYSDC